MTTTAAPPSSCERCKTPLTATGAVDESRLTASESETGLLAAHVEERERIDARVDRHTVDLKTAERLGDEFSRINATRALETAEATKATLDAIIGDNASFDPPVEGRCDGCGTFFHAGRVNMPMMQRSQADHERKASILRAVNEELVGARRTLEIEQDCAEKALAAGDRHAHLSHTERAEALTARIPDIEQAIRYAQNELSALASPPAARAEKRGRRRLGL